MSCGSNGIRTRLRECGGDFPELCAKNEYEDRQNCSVNVECPRWKSWSSWSACSATCGDGESRRTRTCTASILSTCYADNLDTSESYFTRKDVSKDIFVMTNSKKCNLGICSFWQEWSSWTGCSRTCDEGIQSRNRLCYGDFPKMCSSSGKSVEFRECTLGTCGIWQKWSSWTVCSMTCGKDIKSIYTLYYGNE